MVEAHRTTWAAAIIPAGGRARRFGSGENKIWAMLSGKTVLEWTLAAFNNHPAIETIIIAAGSDEMERVKAISAQFAKVHAVVAGGETRTESVRNGLDALSSVPNVTRRGVSYSIHAEPDGVPRRGVENASLGGVPRRGVENASLGGVPPSVLPDAMSVEYVLVHDAARPLVSAELIDRVLAATIEHGAAVPGLALSDTVKRVGADGLVRATIPRTETLNGEILSGLTAVQTPQGAKMSLLQSAYTAYNLPAEPTDEASLIEAFGAPVAIAVGDPRNIKITRQEDLIFAESLISGMETAPTPNTEHRTPNTLYPEIRTGFGYDVHAFAEPEANRPLFLGGIEIPYDRGLEGHSDADVILHAVCDALLGAVSLGDIGIQFPNTDPAYKNISSLKLLANVGERLREMNWRIINIDATVVAEAPKLMPHRDQMQQTMADCLSLEPARLSVKATTSEGMGFVGRREGMACWAVATVQKTKI